MPISFPFPPSSGQRYNYLNKSWIYNGTYWASVRASGAVTSGQLGNSTSFSGNFNVGSIAGNNLTSGLWTVPTSQYVSGGITAYMFDQSTINNNNFSTANYSKAGYFAGGNDYTGFTNLTDKLNYTTETTNAQTTANLSELRDYLAACSYNGVKGYFNGGLNSGGFTVTTSDKLTYSSDITNAQTSTNLNEGRYSLAGCSGDTTKGYFAGGFSTFFTVTTEKLTYSSDTIVIQNSASLSQTRYGLAGISEGTTKGYFAGGFHDFDMVNTADKITYSNDTTAAQTSANLTDPMSELAGCDGEGTKGYFAGGVNSSGETSKIDKVTYSTDTTASLTTATLSQPKSSIAGVSDLATKGYFLGGNPVNPISDKLTYSTDTIASQTSAALSQGRGGLASVNGGNVLIELVTSGKLTTTEANEIISTNIANNSVFSGNISSNNIAIFTVISGYSSFRNAAVYSGHISSSEIGPSAFMPETVLSGNLRSGLIYLPTALGDQMRSGNLAPTQINSGHFSLSDFVVKSSMIGSGQIFPTTLSGQNAGTLYPFATTAKINTNKPLCDYFVFQEQCSGIKAVCIASGSRIVRAQRASGLRLPTIGVTSGNVNSGSIGAVYYYGYVGQTASGQIASGFQGQPLYVGSGGHIVNLSGFMEGASSGAPFLSGDMQVQIGTAMSGGIFVMPSNRITRSGFQGNLPYDI